MEPESRFPRLLSRMGIGILAALALASMARAQTPSAAPADRWLHVRVDNQAAKGEMVRINLPLDLAEKVLPTINNHRLHEGRIRIENAEINGVDLRGLLEAVRSGKDGEYVHVQNNDGEVRIFKKGAYLEGHVRKLKDDEKGQVDFRLPLAVVQAMTSTGNNELDLAAGLRALKAYGDTELVMVKDRTSTVRVWVDSKNISE